MAPNPDAAAEFSPKYYQDDDIVISGISGRFPNCETFDQFKEKLFDGTDILAKEQSRWPDGKLLFIKEIQLCIVNDFFYLYSYYY